MPGFLNLFALEKDRSLPQPHMPCGQLSIPRAAGAVCLFTAGAAASGGPGAALMKFLGVGSLPKRFRSPELCLQPHQPVWVPSDAGLSPACCEVHY